MNADGIKPRGNYDDECERQLVELGAQVIVLMVIGGPKGNGFSVSVAGIHNPADGFLPKLPGILRDMANSIEAQQKLQKNQ
jgi:hypothetical protein